MKQQKASCDDKEFVKVLKEDQEIIKQQGSVRHRSSVHFLPWGPVLGASRPLSSPLSSPGLFSHLHFQGVAGRESKRRP